MTEAYMRGFNRRCQERGVDPNAVVKYAEFVNRREAAKAQALTKRAQQLNLATAPNLGYAGAGAGALLGGAVGALSSREHRLRNFILGAILGAGAGGAGGYITGHQLKPETMAGLNAWLNKAYGKTKTFGQSAVKHTVDTAKEVGNRAAGAARAVGGAKVEPKAEPKAEPKK